MSNKIYLSIKLKFLIGILTFAIPFFIMIFFIVSGINSSINFSQLEIYGIKYQKPLQDIFYNICYLYLFRKKLNSEKIKSIISKINNKIIDIKRIDQSIGKKLQFTEYGLSSRGKKNFDIYHLENKINIFFNNYNNYDNCYNIIEHIRIMINHLGDTSNLILDPDLDSYYLMDITLLALPQMQERLFKIINFVNELIEKKDISNNDLLNLKIFSLFLKESDFDRIAQSTKTSLNEDKNFYGTLKSLQKIIPEEFNSFNKKYNNFQNLLKFYCENNNINEQKEFLEKSEDFLISTFEIWNYYCDELDKLLNIRINYYKKNMITALSLSIFSLIFATIFIFFIVFNILNRIFVIKNEVNEISNGNLINDFNSNNKQIDFFNKNLINLTDEIGFLANDIDILRNNFKELLIKIKESISIIGASVYDLTSSAQEISAISNEQAASVKEIVSTMEDSNNLSKKNDLKITEIVNLSNSSKQNVENGFKLLKENLVKINEIKETNFNTIQGIKFLADQIDNIWEIVNIINSIADQTKIIAFNAELEASAAGEAGKNFKIVANEIRRLADNTVSSTKEIKIKINDIQKSSDNLIIASENGTDKIKEGWELTNKLEKVFEDILRSAEISAESSKKIAISINQQVNSSEQIFLTLKQISESIDNFVLSTRSMTQSSNNLKNLTEIFNNEISRYKI